MSEGIKVHKMESHEIEEMADIVYFANNPLAYLASKIDELATTEDQPGDFEIATELFSEVETDVQVLSEQKTIVLHQDIDLILEHGPESEIGYKTILRMFKELGFSLEVMESVIDRHRDSAWSRFNNIDTLRWLREVYRE